MGLIYIIDYVRFTVIRQKSSAKNKAFKKMHPNEPFPPPYMIYETFRLNYERYFNSGKDTAEWIKKEVSNFKLIHNWHILDWGCGPGRVIRHLPAVIGNGCSFYGSDYNPEYAAWCSQNIPDATFKKNELAPPLLFDTGTMDLVYGLSIFTHLSEQKHYEWLDELLRVLKPGGILFITTHGDITRQNMIAAELNQYKKGELVTRSNVKEGHRMYVAYHPPVFMEKLFAHKAKVLSHQPGKQQSWGLQQDLWIVEKL